MPPREKVPDIPELFVYKREVGKECRKANGRESRNSREDGNTGRREPAEARVNPLQP